VVIARRMLAVAFGLAVGLAIAEVASRAFLESTGQWGPHRRAWSEVELYRPHHHSCYAIDPDGPAMTYRGPHNRLGFRGPEVAARKPEGAFRIACLGGSTTYGSTIALESETWPRRLETLLRETAPSVEVVNAALPAGNSAETLQVLREAVLPLEPDLVVIHDGVNDVPPRYAPSPRGDYARYRRTWAYAPPARARVAGWSAFALLLYDRFGPPEPATALRAWTCWPYVSTPENERREFEKSSPKTFARNVRTAVDASLGAGAGVVLMTPAVDESFLARDTGARAQMTRRSIGEYGQAIRAVAAERGVALCDVQTTLEIRGSFADYSHHTALGAERVARLVAQTIERSNLLARR